MPLIKTKTGRKILRKARNLFVIPYRYDTSLSEYVLGPNLYDLTAIIGDSIALEQNDGDAQTKENEFTNEPLVKNMTSGEWKFTAQCLDLQNAVLKALFAAYTNDSYGTAAIRSDFDTMFALVVVRFFDTSIPDVWMPKVQMNSKLLLQQMKTRGSQGNINGTLFSTDCGIVISESTVSGHTQYQLMPLSDNVSGSLVYTPNVPILFVPQDKKVIVRNNRLDENGETVFDLPRLNTTGTQDCCVHNIVVSDETPGIGII